MPESEPQTLVVGNGQCRREIAYRTRRGTNPDAPGLFWLSGFMSDMSSTKATAVAEWAAAHGLAATCFDYSGHGISGGKFAEGTIGRWLEESEAVFTRVTKGEQIVIGSSMGGHIALLLLRKLMRDEPVQAARIRALVLIAPAWDMTEELMWKRFPEEARRQIVEAGSFEQPSDYGAPYTITRQLIEDGRRHLLARKPFDPGRPVIILQGLLDADVPAAHTQELLTFLRGKDVQLIEIPDGEHRLSRPQDLALLFAEIDNLV